ncbi:hypothetical protein QO282_000512 [Listeria monocytogenes]|nr:hypothetical protein [Listeria monocytogenes]EKZ4810754.1 hypothetical protein [Listeria monocytogenes]
MTESNDLEERLQIAYKLLDDLNEMESGRLSYMEDLKTEMERMGEHLKGIHYEQNNVKRDITELERKLDDDYGRGVYSQKKDVAE